MITINQARKILSADDIPEDVIKELIEANKRIASIYIASFSAERKSDESSEA